MVIPCTPARRLLETVLWPVLTLACMLMNVSPYRETCYRILDTEVREQGIEGCRYNHIPFCQSQLSAIHMWVCLTFAPCLQAFLSASIRIAGLFLRETWHCLCMGVCLFYAAGTCRVAAVNHWDNFVAAQSSHYLHLSPGDICLLFSVLLSLSVRILSQPLLNSRIDPCLFF